MKKQIISLFIIIALLTTQLSGMFNGKVSAADVVSTNDLFMKYPTYLSNDKMKKGLDSAESACYAVINSYNSNDLLISAVMTALNDGSTIIIRDLFAKFGATQSTYDTYVKKAAKKYMDNMLANKNVLTKSTKKVSEAFSYVKSLYKIGDKVTKADIKKSLQEVARNYDIAISESDMGKYVEAVYNSKAINNALKGVDIAMDVWEAALAFAELHSIEMGTLEFLQKELTKAGLEKSDLAIGLSMLRTDIEKDTVNYIITRWGTDTVIKEIAENLQTFLYSTLDVGEITSAIVGVFIKLFVDCVYVNAKADEITQAIMQISYIDSFDICISQYQIKFMKGNGIEDDITTYETLYGAYLSAYSTALDACYETCKLKDKFNLGGDCLVEKDNLEWDYNYEKYIEMCKKSVSDDIASGILKQNPPPEKLSPPIVTAQQATETTGKVSWNAVSGAIYYEAEYKSPNTNNSWKTDTDYKNNTATYYNPQKMGNGVTYYFRVRAISLTGQTSEWSNTASYTHIKAKTVAPKSTLTVLSTVEGNYIVTVPANYTVDCYKNPTDTTKSTWISANTSSYPIPCTKKLSMSDGTTRYFFHSGDNKDLYFIFTNSMSVVDNTTTTQETGTVTIQYDANGGTGAPSSQIVKKDSNAIINFTLPSKIPTRSGYIFKGWRLNYSDKIISAGANINFGFGSATISETLIYYAQWEAVITTYTVTYNANGGSGAPPSQIKIANLPLTISSTQPIRSGYTFMGWGTTNIAPYASYYGGSTYYDDKDITLYAVWQYNLTYTLTYNANGGSGAPSSQIITPNTPLIISSIQPTRSGYTFVGWGTSNNTTNVSYYSGGTYYEDKDITLYAVWQYSNPSSNGAGNTQKSSSTDNQKTLLLKGSIIYYTDTDTQPIASNVYAIAAKLDTNYVLDVQYGGVSDGDPIWLWEKNYSDAQYFFVAHTADDYYIIININSGMAISANGSSVCQKTYTGADTQKWKIEPAGDGSYRISNKSNGLYLDIENAYIASGTNINLFDRNDWYNAQNWYFQTKY